MIGTLLCLLALTAPPTPGEADAPPTPGEADAPPTPGEADAPPTPGEADEAPADDGKTIVRQKRRDLFKTGGAVRLLEAAQLEETNYDDPHSVLVQVPGVYARTEDGYGLRPNIGLRGVSPERSVKVTLMEDGILFGPAPYAAPAAYYFPLVTRMVGVEVTKGPAAVRFGPNTIGGAVDFITRPVPKDTRGAVDLAIGTAADVFDNAYGKLHAWAGTAWDWGGALAEIVHLETDGFKEIDGAPDASTGFSRTEVMLKASAATDIVDDTQHQLGVTLGIAREVSHETYLGLSDQDFRDAPHRRYAASALDRMAWLRWELTLMHKLLIGAFELDTRLYTHVFDRTWRRLNRFRDGPSLAEVLADPEGIESSIYYRILSGVDDSTSPGEALMVARNRRSFDVWGAQTLARYRLVTGDFEHKLELGLRVHVDAVDRLHVESGYDTVSGALVRDALPSAPSLSNEADATALATHVLWAISGHGLTVVPGIRAELIATRFEDRLEDDVREDDQYAILPGIGVHYGVSDRLGVLAGVYRGFSPVAPGQGSAIEPETSINYEAGVRWLDAETGALAELIGFYNDYSNIVGQCTQSSGCDESQADDQYNGGAAEVYGVEVAAAHELDLGCGWSLPARVAYTFTHGEFLTSFDSDDIVFGDVTAGDLIPYVPPHQLALQLGVARAPWRALVAYTFIDRMRERPGRGEVDGELTDAVHLLDVMTEVKLGERVTVYGRGENILGQDVIGSRRPFGARPVKPLMLQLGVKVTL